MDDKARSMPLDAALSDAVVEEEEEEEEDEAVVAADGMSNGYSSSDKADTSARKRPVTRPRQFPQ